jgi:hypothetical protein
LRAAAPGNMRRVMPAWRRLRCSPPLLLLLLVCYSTCQQLGGCGVEARRLRQAAKGDAGARTGSGGDPLVGCTYRRVAACSTTILTASHMRRGVQAWPCPQHRHDILLSAAERCWPIRHFAHSGPSPTTRWRL